MSSASVVNPDRSTATALAVAGRALYGRLGAVLSIYLLALGSVQVALVPSFLGLGAALASLLAAGRLEPAIEAVPSLVAAANPPTDPTGSGSVPPAAADAFGGLVTPISIAAVGLGILGSVVAWVLVRALVGAVTHGAVWAAVDGREPLAAGVSSAGRWPTFLAIGVVRVAFVACVALPVVGLSVVAARSLTSELAILGVVFVLVCLGGLVGVLGVFGLCFAGPAAIVDRVGAIGAVRASLGFVRAHPVQALLFGVVVVVGYVVLGVLTGIATVLGVSSLAAPLLALLLSPILDTAATALYAGSHRRSLDRPGIVVRLRRTLRNGVGAFGRYPRRNPAAMVVAAVCLLAGVAAGYAITAPYGSESPPPTDVATVFGAFPIDTAVNLAANNWAVSARLAFSGLVLALPAIVGLAFNGFVVGGLGGVSDPETFLLLVAPHGVLELPTIAIAGGIGIHLGRVGWHALCGRANAMAVAAELRRAAIALVGVALVLVVAAFIEAFLTPRIAAAIIG